MFGKISIISIVAYQLLSVCLFKKNAVDFCYVIIIINNG